MKLSTRAAFAALVAVLFIATGALCVIFRILVIHLVHPPFAKDLLSAREFSSLQKLLFSSASNFIHTNLKIL